MAKKRGRPSPEPTRSSSSRKTTRRTAASPTPEDVSSLTRVHVWQVQMVRDLLFVAAVIAIFWAGHALRAVTVPLLVALLLAYLFEPVVSRISEHPKISRPFAIATLLSAAGLLGLLVVVLVAPIVVGQASQLVGDVRGGAMRSRIASLDRFVPETLKDEFDELVESLPGEPVRSPRRRTVPTQIGDPATGGDAGSGDAADVPAEPATATPRSAPLTEPEVRALVRRELDDRLDRDNASAARPEEVEDTDWGSLAQRARASVAAILGAVGAVVQVGLLLFLIPFYFFFFSLWYPDVLAFGRTLIPDKNKPRVLELLGRMDLVVAGFVRGRIVISIIMGVMLAIGWMVCGVPYAIVLGLSVGVFCAVPYLGVVGIPLAVGFLFFERLGDTENSSIWWVWVILWPTVVFAVIQLIEGYVLTPMIAGKATNLDPVTILVAVLAGGSVLGVYGMLLAIPIAACLKILCTDVLLPKVQAWTRGEAADPLPIDRE